MVDKTNSVLIGVLEEGANEEIFEKYKDIGDGTYAKVVTLPGTSVVSSENTTEDALGANEEFIGESVSVIHFATIIITLLADQDSAESGLKFQFSPDGENWVTTDEYSYYIGSCKVYSLQTVGPYFRVRYQNGALDQTEFNMCTQLKAFGGIASSHRIGDTIVDDDDAQLVQNVNKAKRPDNRYHNIEASINGNLFVGIGDIQADAGGRVRVSQYTTLGDYKTLNADDGEIWENAGTGTGAFTSNKYNMSVTGGEWLVRSSRRYHHYFSGKSHGVEATFDNFQPQEDVIKRCGYFSSDTTSPYSATLDGFWIESDGSTIRLIASRLGTETLNIAIADWDGYAFLNEYQSLSTWQNFTVVFFDFLWLGGAILRLWVQTSYGFVLAHSFRYAGTAQDVFIHSPNQPIRYEIRSSGAGVGSFRAICAQVSTEGSEDESGKTKGVDTGTTAIIFSTIGTKYPVKAIRLNSSHLNRAVRLARFDMLVASNDNARWTIEIEPTLSASLTYGALAGSAIDHANGDGTITVTSSGVVIASGYVVHGLPLPANILERNFLSYLRTGLAGDQDQHVLCITPITSNVNAFGAMDIKEF